MGSTAGLGLPWPDDTDLVSQDDDAIRALAEAVEANLRQTVIAAGRLTDAYAQYLV